MENLSVRHKNPKQTSKAKKKPVKVVYISNPMKFTTSAAAFRSLVQKLTGRDSEIFDTDEPTCRQFADDLSGVSSPGTEVTTNTSTSESFGEQQKMEHGMNFSLNSCYDEQCDLFDVQQYFAPEVFENFSGFMSATSCYETQEVGGVRKLYDEV